MGRRLQWQRYAKLPNMRMLELYNASLYWIIRERAGAGGWPPSDVQKVSGWTIVRFIADIHGKTVREVAADLIERHQYSEQEQAP